MVKDGTYLIQSETCPHCKKVKAYLAEHHIEYTPISTKEASARNFLKFTGITSIPVLVEKEHLKRTMIVGDKNIIAHFKAQNKPETTKIISNNTSAQSSALKLDSVGLDSDFLSAGADDGCAITITQTPDCTDTNISH